MKRIVVLVAGFCLLVTGCVSREGVVYQTSTIDALLAGVYDGEMSCAQLLRHGDLGIGTFDGLQGEMVVLDGELYQVRADGKVYHPDLSVKTPFATVCNFEADGTLSPANGTDFEAFRSMVDRHAPNQNLFCAIRMTGHFTAMKTRSVPGQTKPYPPLAEVTRNQPEFEMVAVSGSVVGFRCPAYVKGINVPGYHLHFISDDRTQGGHILSFEIAEASCEVDVLNHYALTLPAGASAFAETDLSKDRSQELRRVEQ